MRFGGDAEDGLDRLVLRSEGLVARKDECWYCEDRSPYTSWLSGSAPLLRRDGSAGEQECQYYGAALSLSFAAETRQAEKIRSAAGGWEAIHHRSAA